jgi:hypothetical protein
VCTHTHTIHAAGVINAPLYIYSREKYKNRMDYFISISPFDRTITHLTFCRISHTHAISMMMISHIKTHATLPFFPYDFFKLFLFWFRLRVHSPFLLVGLQKTDAAVDKRPHFVDSPERTFDLLATKLFLFKYYFPFFLKHSIQTEKRYYTIYIVCCVHSPPKWTDERKRLVTFFCWKS